MSSSISFDFRASRNLPKLAWCLEMNDASNVVKVIHGPWVETSEQRFFEGAWASDLASADFDDKFMTGTGGKLTSQGLILVTPNHSLDRLNVMRKEDVLYVSNSLSFLLARSREALDDDFLFYDSYISSIRLGLRKYERSIVTKNKVPVWLYYCCNVLVTDSRRLTVLPKRPSPSFGSYYEYKSYLDSTASRIALNSADIRREVRYAPIATVSRGYDSPATMVISMSAGCRQAITFRESRGTVENEDCGAAIAERLGLEVREFGRLDYRKYPGFPEIENSGGPNEFLSFGDHLSGKLVFTGFNGGIVWDKNCQNVSKDLVRSDASGSSLTEYRLRVGFYHLPVPFIGADSHPSVHAISTSKEMETWSLNNQYDRPIARRIVEEAGVPRFMFGQRKRAAGVVVTLEGLEATMSETSLTDFNRFVDEKWDAPKARKARLLALVKLLTYYNRGAKKVVEQVGWSLGLKFLRVPIMIPHRLGVLAYGYIGKESLLFHWGVEKLVARYNAAIQDRSSNPKTTS